MIQPDYWSTSAQTMPVIALAIVVEARAVMARWTPGENRWYKAFQGLIWSVPLLGYAFAVPACFRALAGRAVWQGWDEVIDFSISAGLSALLFSAFAEFVLRSYARAFVTLVIAARSREDLVYRWKSIRMLGRVRRRIAFLDRSLTSNERTLDSQVERIMRLGHPECPACSSLLAGIGDTRRRIHEHRAEVVELVSEIETLRHHVAENQERYAERVSRMEIEFEAMLAQNGLAPPSGG
ncbi:hypothetical protein [Dactylosporangium sp. NPDC048998]|uniref:hypothetical protein n=1 Tax=Dactylosporangium sp. NPDC048998 TaxID=3363976 RepID=UPI003719FE32